MKPATRLTTTIAITALLAAVACTSGGDEEYTEDGQLVEKTDVRVTGVELGRAVDGVQHITDETDVFAPGDTIYTSVRTTGSSPKTVLGVRWRNPDGDEVGGYNLVIRPVGDTSTLFTYPYSAGRGVGRYTLDVRVNGKVVKTADFQLSTTREPRAVSVAAEPAPAPGQPVTERHTGLAAVRPFVRKTFARLTDVVANLFEREPRDQSPFEWRGLRGGMSFAKMNRLTRPAAPWKCTPFFLSSVGLERDIALQNEDFSAGHIVAMVDTVGKRVFRVQYSTTWMPPDTGRRVAFERELTALSAEWDKLPGVIRHPRDTTSGPSSAKWETPDSVWSAKIFYSQPAHGPARPDGFEIEEIHWGEALEASLTDSVKAQMHNPESPFYRNANPNAACDALLQSK
jgi:hypothetical protein